MLSLLAILILAAACAAPPEKPAPKKPTESSAATAAVSTADPIATQVGMDILAQGGNAADAAVAIGFALAVCYPSAGNLGGGGFAVTYRPGDGSALALDFRETAPLGATRDMYLDKDGNVVQEKSRFGHLAVGVPGSVAGMWELHERLGSLKWSALLAPAIRLADEGFLVSHAFAEQLEGMREKFLRHPATAKQFTKPDGSSYAAGDTLRQKELAATLRLISQRGPRGFYEGATAHAIVAEMVRGQGLITHADLESYEAKWRNVVGVDYRGHRVWSMPPPSSGGICLGMMLNMLGGWQPSEIDLDSSAGLHRYIESARRAYADRATHLGDSDFWDVPRDWLLSSSYAAERRATIGEQATKSAAIQAGAIGKREGEETTHYSVLDPHGFAVSVTTTLNFGYGSLITVPGAGFLLNNEMDDFSAKPGVPNAYGLVGAEANAVAPRKRMLSSMSPTIVTKDGDVVMVVGTPGGSTIITTVLQVIVRVLDMGQSLADAVAAPRIHHQWLPDTVFFEEERAPKYDLLLPAIEARGNTVEGRGLIGDVCAILVTPTNVSAVADSRRRGSAAVQKRPVPAAKEPAEAPR
jgi:gamma-glutamyltranspeptidase/glutathione hydrolase